MFDKSTALQQIDKASATPHQRYQGVAQLPLCPTCHGTCFVTGGDGCRDCKGSGRKAPVTREAHYLITDPVTHEAVSVPVRPDPTDRTRVRSKVRSDIFAYQHWRKSGQGAHPVFNRAVYREVMYKDGVKLPQSNAELCLECIRPRPCACKPKVLRVKTPDVQVTVNDAPRDPREMVCSASNGRTEQHKASIPADEFMADLAKSVFKTVPERLAKALAE